MRQARDEGALRATVWMELPGYQLAEGATQTLLGVLHRAELKPHEGEDAPPADYWRAKAMLYLGTLALRTARAAMAVVASGYEDQAIGLQRTLLEVHRHTTSNTRKGQDGRSCARGRDGRVGARV